MNITAEAITDAHRRGLIDDAAHCALMEAHSVVLFEALRLYDLHKITREAFDEITCETTPGSWKT